MIECFCMYACAFPMTVSYTTKSKSMLWLDTMEKVTLTDYLYAISQHLFYKKV